MFQSCCHHPSTPCVLSSLCHAIPDKAGWKHTAVSCMSVQPPLCTRQHADCRAYVRYLGLSVNQPLHMLGCGDFNIDRIEVAEAPSTSGRPPAANWAQVMDMAGVGSRLVAVADPSARQGVVRLNTPDPLAGEQTWPTTEVHPHLKRPQLRLSSGMHNLLGWQC